MSLIDDKRAWRAFQARVKALPQDYRIVYELIQKYVFKVAPFVPTDVAAVLEAVLGMFEEGAAAQRDVLAVCGKDVGGFVNELIAATPAD